MTSKTRLVLWFIEDYENISGIKFSINLYIVKTSKMTKLPFCHFYFYLVSIIKKIKVENENKYMVQVYLVENQITFHI